MTARTKDRPRSGDTVAGLCPDPRFKDVLWSEDIDWTEQEATAPTEDERKATVSALLPDLSVGLIRSALGVAWNEGEARLSVEKDKIVAARLGVKEGTVRADRCKRGVLIRDGARRVKEIDWDSVGLGTDTDRNIAKRLNLTHQVISRQREIRGIPLFNRTAHWDQEPLGKESDAAIAARLGCHRSAVKIAREERGIPAFRNPEIDWDAQRLGTDPDVVIAERTGKSRSLIMLKRQERGIPAPPRTYRTAARSARS